MAPNSVFWTGLQNSIQFEDNRFLLKMSHFPNHEFLEINSAKNFKRNVVEIDPTSPLIRFPSHVEMKNTVHQKISKDMSICLDNSANLHFQTIKSMEQLLRSLLCRDPNDCDGEEDLNIFDDNETAVMVTINGKMYNSDSKGNG
jgi:hypothetical protein